MAKSHSRLGGGSLDWGCSVEGKGSTTPTPQWWRGTDLWTAVLVQIRKPLGCILEKTTSGVSAADVGPARGKEQQGWRRTPSEAYGSHEGCNGTRPWSLVRLKAAGSWDLEREAHGVFSRLQVAARGGEPSTSSPLAQENKGPRLSQNKPNEGCLFQRAIWDFQHHDMT